MSERAYKAAIKVLLPPLCCAFAMEEALLQPSFTLYLTEARRQKS